MKTLRQIKNRIAKMDLDFDLIPAMNCYDKMTLTCDGQAGEQLEQMVKKFDLTVAEFGVWMTFDIRIM